MIVAAFNLARWIAYLLGENPPAVPGGHRQPASIKYFGEDR